VTQIKYTQSFPITTALKIIRHIASGIYRDLGGSLKELVSNSFDAQATDVEIWSGYPGFETIKVIDNGQGIPEEVLHKAFENIGLSTKVTHPEWYEGGHGRPIIGRFGIGFLASAHISRNLLIRTFTDPSKPGLEIHMDLTPYFRFISKIDTTDEYHFGSVEYATIDNSTHQRGTSIELRDVHEGEFYDILQTKGENFMDWPSGGSRAPADGRLMNEFVEQMQSNNVHALPTLDGRNQLLWHLGMTTPVRYLRNGPVDPKLARGEAAKVIEKLRGVPESFDFRLWFDGVEIRKPLLLPTPPTARTETEEGDVGDIDDSHVWPIRISGSASNGKRVRAEGYLFFQPYRVLPVESRGLLPRIDGVGVGATLDNTFLSDLKSESPLFRVQVSGELYIVEGLAEALDLDRSGFLQVDVEFRYLLKHVSEIVQAFVREAAQLRRSRNKRITRQKHQMEFDQRMSELSDMLTSVGVSFSIVPSSRAVLDRSVQTDYESRAAYPSSRPRMVIERPDGKARVELDVDDPYWLALAALVDNLLGECSDAANLRKRFADGLTRLDGHA
jgi:hypothetical protein